MDLKKKVDAVTSRDDFAAFVDALRNDLNMHPDDWENPTLDRFLEALCAWVRDSGGYYQGNNLPAREPPSWKNFAEMMLAAKCDE